MLEGKDLHFGYRNRRILEGVSLGLEAGTWIALLGPNGAGKSTLLALLAGLKRPTRGQVLLEGRPLLAYSPWERGRRLAYLPQGGPIPWGLRVEEVVALGRSPHLGLLGRMGLEDKRALAWALEVTETAHLAGRTLETLSGGERQRVLLARALATRPRYLLLDEPTVHLDLHHQAALLRLLTRLREEGLGLLTVLHDPNQALAADRVLLLAEGRVVAAGPWEEVVRLEVLEGVYGQDVRVARTWTGERVVLPNWR